MMEIEDRADRDGKGSVWRACLAVSRCDESTTLGDVVMQIAISYCNGDNTALKQLGRIYADNLQGAHGEFKEALKALKNAIDMAPNKSQHLAIDDRQELWVRLERLLDQ